MRDEYGRVQDMKARVLLLVSHNIPVRVIKGRVFATTEENGVTDVTDYDTAQMLDFLGY